jgi:hypothetical protein
VNVTFSASKLLLLVAAVCFILATFGIASLGPMALLPLGLFFLAAAGLV